MHNHSLTDGPTGTPVHPHPVALRHSALGAALCLLFSLLTLFAVSLFFSGFTIPINRDLSGFVNGFYPTEGDYTWTEGTATIHLSGLNRHSAWKCQLIFSSACPIQDQLPFVTIMIDGHPSLKVRASNAIQMIDIPISPNAHSSDLLLTLSSSPIFVPSSQDTRALGVMIRGIRFTCEGIPWLPGRQLILALLIFSLIFGAFLGYTLRSAASIAFFSLLAGSGYVSLISYSVARYYPPFLWHSAVIAVSIASLLSVAVFCRHVFRCELTMMDRYALVSVAIVASIEIAVLLHPHKPDMDDTMHVHRFLAVQSGNYFLTETAPGGYVSP